MINQKIPKIISIKSKIEIIMSQFYFFKISVLPLSNGKATFENTGFKLGEENHGLATD